MLRSGGGGGGFLCSVTQDCLPHSYGRCALRSLGHQGLPIVLRSWRVRVMTLLHPSSTPTLLAAPDALEDKPWPCSYALLFLLLTSVMVPGEPGTKYLTEATSERTDLSWLTVSWPKTHRCEEGLTVGSSMGAEIGG